MMLIASRLGWGWYVAFAVALAIMWTIAVGVTEAPRGRVVVTETETEILDVVEFEPGTALLRSKSFATLDAVAATLIGNPSIERIEVQSHVNRVRCDTANLRLTEQRAAAVMAYLVNAGVDPARLDAQGYGDTQPIDHAGSPKNERVSFLILERSSDQ